MSGSFSVWAEIFGRRQAATSPGRMPTVGEIYAHQPERGPVEYAEVIGVYKEAADILHVRFRLYYGYQDKTTELGERTLALSLFNRRFTQHLRRDTAAE
jgi:hypothetical protein